MRKLGSVMIMLFAVVLLVAVWFATPYMMRTTSHLWQFAQVVAAGAVVALGVMTLVAGVVMRKAPAGTAPPPRTPPARSVPEPSPQLRRIAQARYCFTLAEEMRKSNPTTSDLAGELWQLERCVNDLLCMVEDSIPKTEGRKEA